PSRRWPHDGSTHDHADPRRRGRPRGERGRSSGHRRQRRRHRVGGARRRARGDGAVRRAHAGARAGFDPAQPGGHQGAADLAGRPLRSDSGISIKPISVYGTQRVFRFAFRWAIDNGRRKVTAVHKANIMKHTDGLWLRVAEQVAREFPDIEFEDRIVDNMAMQLVQKPELYDVMVMPNLYGDILSDLCAGLVGGLGLAPGANTGDDIAVFEATHGSAPKYAGLNK